MKTNLLPLKIIASCFLLFACSKEKQPDASGTFEAVETIISAEAQGKLVLFELNEGTELQAGQAVGLIDTVQLYLSKLQLMQTQKAILSGRPQIHTQLESLKKELENAKTDRDRIQNLVSADVASQKQLDDAKLRIDILTAKISAQETVLNTTTSNLNEQAATVNIQLQQTENHLAKCHIINPIKGTVISKYAEQNEITLPGKPLYKIANLSTILLRAYVTGDQMSSLKLGQKVQVLVDAKDGGTKEYAGTIEWISDKAEFTPKTVQTKDERANLVYATKIKVNNDGLIKIGMYGDVRF